MQRFLYAATVLVPVDVVADALGAGDTTLFLLSALALIPLAWVIGEATEQVGEHTGPAIAGLLNASFGNAPELMVSLFAVSNGLFVVVRGSLTGSVVGNLLLVLGCSLAFGGRGEVSRRSVLVSTGQVGLATLLFLIPATAGDRDATVLRGIPVAIVLLLLYVVTTALAVRDQMRAQRARTRDDDDVPEWSLARGLVVLGLATVATVVATEILTNTIEGFARSTGIGEFFTAAVVVAIVGNAAEHGGAVVIASRGRVELASEIALSSAAQVALFVIPAVALLSLAIDPLPLAIRPVEFAALGAAVLLPTLLLLRGRSSRWRGLVLTAAYAGAAVAFLAAS